MLGKRAFGGWVGGLGMLLLCVGPAVAQVERVPMSLDWSVSGASVVDLSRFLDEPAGRDGPIRVSGEHLIRPDGRRFRIWGVNLCGPDCFPDHDQADALALDLARLGINAVRFHHMDSDWGRSVFDASRNDTRHLDPANLERLDYLIAQLKNRGIYSNLNLNVLRKYKAGDGVRDFAILGVGKGSTYFHPRLIELQREYARQLLTHVNPYTKNAYRDEPAVITVEILNENSLLEAWVQWRLIGRDDREGNDITWAPLPVSYAEELTALYHAWLPDHVQAESIAAIRKEVGVGPTERIPRLRPFEFEAASALRFRTEAAFYVDLERRFFAGMHDLLKDELQVKALVASTADHNDSYAAYAHIATNAMFDIVDGHGYWQHPEIGAKTKCANTPMVDEPYESTVFQFARTPYLGKPFTISEVNHPFPHEYACEGIPILTAYALLHDWDGIYWFTWGKGRLARPEEGIPPNSWFDVSVDPVKLAEIAACGLMWHRGDLKVADETTVRLHDLTNRLDLLRAKRTPGGAFFSTELGLGLPFYLATRWTVDPALASPTPLIDPFDAQHPAITRELGWSKPEGQVTIDSDRTQGVIGRLGGREAETLHLKAWLDTPFSAVLLTALDDRPIGESDRLLLLTGSSVANSGQRWEEPAHHTLAEWGHGPVLVEPVRGKIALRNLTGVDHLRITPLSPVGARLAESWTTDVSRNGTATFPVGDPPAVQYLIERVP